MTDIAEPSRVRGVAVVVRDGQVLMVEHKHPDRSIWTMPGGGVEDGETAQQAVTRELLEETGLIALSLTYLGEAPVNGQQDTFFHVDVDPSSSPACGCDPELPADRQVLNDVAWIQISELVDDCQWVVVEPLLSALSVRGPDPDGYRVDVVERA